MDIQQLKKEKTINYSENFFDETYDYLYKELLDLELDEQLSFLKDNYLKYLENKLREAFGFKGTPIKISAKEKGEKQGQ